MHELCRHCQNLLNDIYCFIYKTKTELVEFVLTPMPRLEVETIQDFKVLFDIGALTPDMSLELSRIMLGNASKPRKQNSEKDDASSSKDAGALLQPKAGGVAGSGGHGGRNV
jgi:hypothetical protein